ncbi:MAG: helicase C-terminal domain-containing protein [Bacillota bacterium]
MLEDYVALDVETTGLNPAWDSIIEVGLLKIKGGRVVDSYHSLVAPERELPPYITRLTGISGSMLEDAPPVSSIRDDLQEFIAGEYILGHGIGFDVGFMEKALGTRLEGPFYDTLELSRVLMPGEASYRLADLCSAAGIELAGAHRAMEDARAAVMLYGYLCKLLSGMAGQTVAYLGAMLQRAGSAWGAVISNIPAAWEGGGAYIINEPTRSRNDRFFEDERPEAGEWGYVDPDRVREIISKNGTLSRKMPSYEYRPQQVEMAEEVARAFNEEKFLIVEAGTGTGKSISYLVPSLLWAAGGGPRVLISTMTINLQEQLWRRDIPQLAQCLQIDVKTALVKGRSNYICLRRWENVLLERKWSEGEAFFYAGVLVWLEKTLTGDRAEINTGSGGEEFWQEICAESDNCMGSRCRHFKDRCFVSRARREAEAAGIIITNHALLFSDVRSGNMVLPPYGPVIIDEAHHIEDVASEQLGRRVLKSDLKRWLNRAAGLISRLWELVPPSEQDKWMDLLVALRGDIARLREAAEVFFSLAGEFMCRKGAQREGDQGSFRFVNHMLYEEKYGLPWAEFSNLIVRMKGFRKTLDRVSELLQAWCVNNESWSEKLRDIVSLTGGCEEITADMEFIYNCDDDSFVYWLSFSGREERSQVSLNAAPIRVGGLLYDSFFSCRNSVVMTSATLSADGSFDFFAERTGVNRIATARVVRKQIESPFQYDVQSLLCVVENLPLQGAEPGPRYLKVLSGALEELVLEIGGKTLVLFTSHRVLRDVYSRVKKSLEEKGITVLGHNIDAGRSRLVDEFMKSERAVLMGSSSFWEGVDIPGADLSSVVIVKLPFSSPSEPVIQARMEDLADTGRIPFNDYYLPLAVIRFKQGFGRLIRTEADRGVVIVLDGRIVAKSYGRKFLRSLPVTGHFSGDLATVKEKVRDWFHK